MGDSMGAEPYEWNLHVKIELESCFLGAVGHVNLHVSGGTIFSRIDKLLVLITYVSEWSPNVNH